MNAVTSKPAPIEAASLAHAAAPARPRRRRALLRGAAVLAAVLGAVVGGHYWIVEGQYVESTDNAYVQGDIAVLSPRIEGDVAAIPVADNQPVHAGDPLVVLDRTDWQARLDQALGTQAEAEAAVATAILSVAQARAAIDQAGAMVAQAEAELVRASAEDVRTGTLAGAGWSSRQAREQTTADAAKAQAGLAAARAAQATSVQAERVAEAQVRQAQARRQTAAAASRLAASNLDHTVIRAPFDGVAGNRSAQLGQHLMAGAPVIAVAPAAARLFVVANFKETQLTRMQPGQAAVLTADIGGAPLHARVDSMAPATGALFSLLPPENATGNFTKVVQRVPVKLVIDAPDALAAAAWLRAGLSVTAEVDTRGPAAERRGVLGTALAWLP